QHEPRRAGAAVERLAGGPPWHRTVPESLPLTAHPPSRVTASAGQASDGQTHIHLLPARIHHEQFVLTSEQHREGHGGARHRARTATKRERDRAIHRPPPWMEVIRTDQKATARDGDALDPADEV